MSASSVAASPDSPPRCTPPRAARPLWRSRPRHTAPGRSGRNAAQEGGGRLRERWRAGPPRRGGGQWVVSTATGSVRADKVIIGTNGYTDLAGAQGPSPKPARPVIPVSSYTAATRPLSDDLRRTILPKGQAVSDSRRLLRYFRLDAAGRMVLGGPGRTRGSADWSDYARSMAGAVVLHPDS